MNYSIKTIPNFEKQLKRLLKKYPSFKIEFINFIQLLSKHPKQGTALGNNCYKIRVAISAKGKGKSGGARIITNIQIIEAQIYLLSIYDKSEQADISDKDLQNLISKIKE